MSGGGGFDFRDIIKVRTKWRQQLVRQYESEARRLLDAYTRTRTRITPARDLLLARLTELEADKALTVRRVRGLAELERLIDNVTAEMDDFAVILRDQSARLQASGITAGTQSAAEMVRAGSGRMSNIVMNRWMTPDPEMLRSLINYVDSEAMQAKFAAFGSNAGKSISDTILTLTAQGKNPRAIAQALKAWDALPYAWAENTARTVQQYSYRQATSLNYRANSDVVEGWVWYTALDDQVCPSCLAMHGTFHGNDEILNGHHQCRCVQIPKVTGSRWADEMETGEQWFARQPDSVQRGIMGKGMHAAYKAGDIDFSKLSTTYNDPVYGEMRRAATLKELGISRTPAPTGSRRVSAPTPVRAQGQEPRVYTQAFEGTDPTAKRTVDLDRLMSYDERSEPWAQSLSDDEREAIRTYTGVEYTKYRQQVRGDLNDAEIARGVENFLSGASRAPRVDGLVWRGIVDETSYIDMTALEAWTDLKGRSVVFREMNSASISPKIAAGFANKSNVRDKTANIVFEISTQNARYIKQASAFDNEYEAILMPESLFRVVDVIAGAEFEGFGRTKFTVVRLAEILD